MRALDLCILKLFLLILLAASCEFQAIDFKPLDKCSSACVHEMKSLLSNNWETHEQLKAYESAMLEMDKKIAKMQKQLDYIQTDQTSKNNELIETFNEVECSNENKKSIESMQTQLNSNAETLVVLLNEIVNLNNSISIHNTKDELQPQLQQLAEYQAINCMPFENSSKVENIFVNGYGNISVLCDAKTDGSGWLVVQRRFSGNVDFYRNWTEYKQGFGNLDDEFFIGLEALHHLTKSLPYELYVMLTDFDNNIRHARYDNFLIGSEQEEYMLKSLGMYTGNAGNALSYNLHDSFTTYDQDNDGWSAGNCAVYYLSGWWYNLYGNSNLNGRYFDKKVHSEQSIWWYNWKGYEALKSVQMMIRPKYTSI